MGKSKNSHTVFGTKGNPQGTLSQGNAERKARELAEYSNKTKIDIFENGHVTLQSISNRREYFLGKNTTKIENVLLKEGYQVKRALSKHSNSKAKLIITLNSNKIRNITQIQISSGSIRHGNVPYVKISTNDIGRIKIINAKKENYKTDGKENAILLFRRYWK